MKKIELNYDNPGGQEQLSEEQGKCPYCGSEDVDFQGPDFQDGMIYYDGHCSDCDNDFVEWYEVEYNSTYGYPIKKKSKKEKK